MMAGLEMLERLKVTRLPSKMKRNLFPFLGSEWLFYQTCRLRPGRSPWQENGEYECVAWFEYDAA
jgi:hypothetical protein